MCECWEDLEASDLLDKKLQQMGLKQQAVDCYKHSSTASAAAAATAGTGELDKMSPAATSSAGNAVKILRRPSAEPANRKNKNEDESGTKLNVNSQPFVPRSQVPTIQLEDSTRTQFKPKLMILKREKTSSRTSGSDAACQRQAAQSRTFEEREAEYLKARERIMGSATSSPTEPVSSNVKSSSPALLPTPPSNRVLIQGQPEVPLLRQPQGPSTDGDRGFVRTKR